MWLFTPGFHFNARRLLPLILLQIIFHLRAGFAQSDLQPSLDLIQYQDAAHLNYLEISYSLSEAALKYLHDPKGEGYSYALVMALQIYQDKTLWASRIWKIERSVSDTTQIDKRREIVDKLHYLIEEPGNYRVALYARDVNQPVRQDSAVAAISTRIFSRNSLELSDLILAAEIKRAAPNSSSVFVRNGYEVTPNPRQIYGEGAPLLYYYFEAYNLKNFVPGSSYKTYCLVKDANGKPAAAMASPYRTKKKQHDFSVEMGTLNLSQLPSGAYSLVYGITDSAEHLLQHREKRFYIYNPALTTVASALEREDRSGSEALKPLKDLSETELDKEFERMLHLTQPEDKKFYSSLANAEAKQKYLSSLWQSRQPADSPNAEAYRKLYLTRVRQAETQYASPFRPGWKGEQGRVFILYGAPTHVERNASTSETKPYEIWTYDHLQGQGGVIFVFADRTGFKNYEMIHSTLRGELQNPNWRQLVVLGADSFR